MLISLAEYHSAIISLGKGIAQLVPDGKICTICLSPDHFAFECMNNPLVEIEILKAQLGYLIEAKVEVKDEDT